MWLVRLLDCCNEKKMRQLEGNWKTLTVCLATDFLHVPALFVIRQSSQLCTSELGCMTQQDHDNSDSDLTQGHSEFYGWRD